MAEQASINPTPSQSFQRNMERIKTLLVNIESSTDVKRKQSLQSELDRRTKQVKEHLPALESAVTFIKGLK